MKKYKQSFSRIGFIALAVVMLVPTFANAAVLTRQLQVGMSGSDVSSLQTFLAVDPTIYPQGLVTGYFGFLTKSGVSNFQSRNGIPAVGRVGPVTLNAINAQMANGGNMGGDQMAPAISNVSSDVGKTTSTITWNTSDSARGKVYYSTSPIQFSNTFDQTGVNFVEPSVSGTLAPYDSATRTSHSVSISSLDEDTKYYYSIVVLDQSNNVNITLGTFFKTNQ